MSQSGRLTTNHPVPGAGIQTVTGNVGGAVPGDGAANIGLVGAGTITVTGNPGANTLTISSAGLPATYTSDVGIVAPDAFGNINVLGGTNINTAGVGDTLTINLDDDVDLLGHLHAATDIEAPDIAATNILSGATILGDDMIINHGVNIGTNVADVTFIRGSFLIDLQRNGVLQTDNIGTVTATNGVNGQLLIGGGVAPVWNNITAGAGIVVTNAASNITLSCTAAVAQQFNTDAGNAIPVASIIRVLGGLNINTTGAGNIVTVNLDDDVNLIGHLHTGTEITAATGNITATAGDITATVGNVSSGLDLISGRDLAVTRHAVLGTNPGDSVDVMGILSLANNLWGVLQTNGVGAVSATNGIPALTNGQVLISGPVRPTWASITSADGSVVITHPVANSINLSVIGNQAAGFSGSLAARAVNATGNGTVFQFTPTVITLNDNANYNAANGRWTIPFAGNYFITVNLAVTGMTAAMVGLSFDYYYNIPVPPASSNTQLLNCNPWYTSNSYPNILKVTGSKVVYLNPALGDYLTFAIIAIGGPRVMNIEVETVLSIWPIF